MSRGSKEVGHRRKSNLSLTLFHSGAALFLTRKHIQAGLIKKRGTWSHFMCAHHEAEPAPLHFQSSLNSRSLPTQTGLSRCLVPSDPQNPWEESKQGRAIMASHRGRQQQELSLYWRVCTSTAQVEGHLPGLLPGPLVVRLSIPSHSLL